MAEKWGEFRVVDGLVVVRGDAIAIRSTPREFVAGQYGSFRTDAPFDRVKALAGLVGFVLTPILLVGTLLQLADVGFGWFLLAQLASVAAVAYATWRRHIRETVIPLSAIDRLSVGEADRRLEISHGRQGRLSALFPDETRTRTHVFRTDDDVREARELFRLRGIEVADLADEAPETTYRIESRGGVCFCEDCGSQVSPSDRACPACGYALRVEVTEQG